MSRGRRKEQRAAVERKRSDGWQQERDDDTAREEIPDDEYPGMDEFPKAVKEFRQ